MRTLSVNPRRIVISTNKEEQRHTAVRQQFDNKLCGQALMRVPTSFDNPALYSKQIEMFNKERFHNQLALNLGYQRIVNDKRINISIDDKQYPDDVMISICIDGSSTPICYRASEGLKQSDMDCLDENGYDDIKVIVDAVHQAYIDSTRELFSCYNG